MKLKNILLCTAFFLLSSNQAWAQSKQLLFKNVENSRMLSLLKTDLEAMSASGTFILQSLVVDQATFRWNAKGSVDSLLMNLERNSVLDYSLSEKGSEQSVISIGPTINQFRLVHPLEESFRPNLENQQRAKLSSSMFYTEAEGNDTFYLANKVSTEKNIIGQLHGRVDQDFYLFESGSALAGLSVLLLEKTSYSPVARLFDQDFNLISTTSLNSNETLLIPPANLSGRVYLQIADKIGYIALEPGRILEYKYLLSIK